MSGAVETAERVLRQNWLEGEREGTRFAYTRPSPNRYPWQWFWDSCFAAIVWRRFDAGRSRLELESLLAAQREDGFIGHTIFWDRQVSLTRLPFYNVRSRGGVPDRDDSAAAAGLGLADRRRRPCRGAADRPPDGLARRQSRPRRRRAALDRPARRVRPRRLAQVRGGLGSAGERDRLPVAGPAQPPARLRRAPDPRARRAAALRTDGQHASGRSRCRRWAARRRPRPSSSGSGTSASGSSSTRRSRAACARGR